MAKRRLRRASSPSQSPSASYPQSLRDSPEARGMVSPNPFGREAPSEGPIALLYRLRLRIPSHFVTAPRHGEWFPRYPFGRETPSEGPVALFYRLRSRIPSHFVTAPRGDLQFGVRIASRYSIDLQILRKRLQKTETYISQFSPIKYCRSPISWMVRCQTPEPSTITPQITDGPISRPEPSTLEAGITDGPIPQDRTFHAGDQYRGWLDAKHRNPPR